MHQDGDIPEKRVLIFSDSACCVGYLERGWNRPTKLETARGTKADLHSLRKSLQVGVYWIRGHSHVHWNEVSDTARQSRARSATCRLERPM
jgi:hypothetical protein